MKKSISLLLAMLATLGLNACTAGENPAPTSSDTQHHPSSSTVSTTLADIQNKGELVIGLDDTFAPMGFRDENNELVGFDIDLATAVCAELGVEPVFQPIDWSAKELELTTGRVDCLWNGLSLTPEREEQLCMTGPYLNNRIIVMTNAGVTIDSLDQLADYRVGTQAASSALAAVQNSAVYADLADNLVEYKDYDAVILDMQAGRIDAMIVDEVLGQYKNAKLGNPFGCAAFNFGDDLYAVGFRKGDTELAAAVEDAIDACRENGKAAEISEKWFGADIVVD